MLGTWIAALVTLAVFVWLFIPSKRTARVERDTHDDAYEMGVGTGLMGGDIEDAVIASYALRRTPRDPNSSEERDRGTALGMQNAIDP